MLTEQICKDRKIRNGGIVWEKTPIGRKKAPLRKGSLAGECHLGKLRKEGVRTITPILYKMLIACLRSL